MIKIIMLTLLFFVSYISILSALGVNYIPPPDTTAVKLQPLNLPSDYNPSYVLGFYDGGHKTTHMEYYTGLKIGLVLNSVGFIIAPLATHNSQPGFIPAGVNKKDYIKGYSERSASLNRHAAFKGAVTGAVIQTAAFFLIVAFVSN